MQETLQAKLAAAEEATARVQAACYVARNILNDTTVTNGYGIYRDPSDVKRKLELARQRIDDAIKTMDGTGWLSTDDYDAV